MHFTSHFGFCLHPISIKNVPSLVRLVLNTAISLGLYHFLAAEDAFQINQLIFEVEKIKPFFSLLIRFCFMHAGMGFYFVVLIYFGVVGRRVVALLDSLCLQPVYFSHKQTKRIFIKGVAFNSLIWLLNNISHIMEVFESSSILHTLIFGTCLYIYCTLSHFVIFSIYYLQQTTMVILTKIDISLHDKIENDVGKFGYY